MDIGSLMKTLALPRFTFVGSYPLFYVPVAHDVCLCPECAEKEGVSQDRAQVNWENPDLSCCECGNAIEAAYE